VAAAHAVGRRGPAPGRARGACEHRVARGDGCSPLAAKDTLRGYVKQVLGSADPEVPQSEALAAWVLGPFNDRVAELASRSAARGKRGAAAPPSDASAAGAPSKRPAARHRASQGAPA
jgi:hypothetical protein